MKLNARFVTTYARGIKPRGHSSELVDSRLIYNGLDTHDPSREKVNEQIDLCG